MGSKKPTPPPESHRYKAKRPTSPPPNPNGITYGKVIKLIIPHAPISQPRQRHRVVRKKDGTDFVQNYTPKDAPVHEYKAAIRHHARQVYWGEPLTGPLRVDIVFVFPRPKNKVWKTKPMPRYLHTIKPDRDNSDKPILDALQGVVWHDDCQVCDGRLQKFVAAGDEQPHVEVTITEILDMSNMGVDQ